MYTKFCKKCGVEFYVDELTYFVPKHGEPVPSSQQYCNPCLNYMGMQSGSNNWGSTDSAYQLLEKMKPYC